MNHKAQLGFGLGLGGGLSDTVVTLGIISILAGFGYYAFQDYKVLVRVTEAINSTANARTAIEKTFAKNAVDMSQLVNSLPSANEPLQSVSIARDGTITLQFTDKVAPPGENVVQIVPVFGGKAVDLSLAANAGRKFEWQCGGPAGKTTLPEKYRPKSCR